MNINPARNTRGNCSPTDIRVFYVRSIGSGTPQVDAGQCMRAVPANALRPLAAISMGLPL